jgi:hypothetical protein
MVISRLFQIKTKVSLCIIFFIAFLFALYIFFTWKNYTEADEVIYSSGNNYVLLIKYNEPFFSFGSGHKIIRLYSKYFLFRGKIIFGEFPFKIVNWDLKNNIISIEIEDSQYIRQFTNRRKIGNFYIDYVICRRRCQLITT